MKQFFRFTKIYRVNARKTDLFLQAFVLLILFFLLVVNPAISAEIVTNGGFEQQAGNLAANWQIRGNTAGMSGLTDNSTRVSGAYSLRITNRSDALDGPQQSILANLNAAGSGNRFAFAFSIKTDDIASARALLKYKDAAGQKIDAVLAESVISSPGQWTRVEGSFPLLWEGALQSAYIVFDVVQISRNTGILPGNLVPAYNLDDVSMDLDNDGDYLFDRDEASLGFDSGKADSDDDGLPDRWELDHGFSSRVNEAALDSDSDDFSNLEEYFAATDPRSALQYPGKPANPNANTATREVLQWLALLPSRSGPGHLAVGQMVSDLSSPTEYPLLVDNLAANTGKYPAILQMAIEPPYDRFGIPLQIDIAESRALDYWQEGGLVMLKWAMYNPWVTLGPGTQTAVDIPGLLEPANSSVDVMAANEAAHDTMLNWMSTVADAMERLDEQGVVIMFRPLSEMNGGWFWWGMRPQTEYIDLWRYIFHYFTNTRGLNNIIWVYESDSGSHAPSVVGGPGYSSDYYYPGDDYVDVMSHNLYNATWELSFDSNEVYSRYPKIYGIPQAGPDHANRDGSFDNLVYLRQSEDRLPRSSFFIVWNSFTGNTGIPQKVAIVDNANASALMNEPAIITRDKVSTLVLPVNDPVETTISNQAPQAIINGNSGTVPDTDGQVGESLDFSASATDTDGSIVTMHWLVNGAVVASGMQANLTLPDGSSDVTFQVIDDNQALDSATITITVEGPTALKMLESTSSNKDSMPDSRFAIALQLAGNARFVDEAASTDVVRISGYFYPQMDDMGASADIFVVVLTPDGYLMRNSGGNFVLWNGKLNSLVPAFEGQILNEGLGLELYNGPVKSAGAYKVFIGYLRTDKDELVYSRQPKKFTVH